MNVKNPMRSGAGTYLISPVTRLLENGWYACSVTIRCGSGLQATRRVLRLTRMFRDHVAACEYAISEGLQWVRVGRAPLRPAPA
jgi:hypothetical protein